MKKIISIFLSFVLSLGILFVEPKVTIAAAPTDYVSCWNFDETSGTRIDSNTTNSNDLADNNTVLSGTGKIGNAADFESTNSEFLSITDATQVGLDFSTAMSVSVWLNEESYTDGIIVGKLSTGQEAFYIQADVGGSNNLQRFSDSAETTKDVTSLFNTGTWYHVVYIYNAGSYEVYVNGTSAGTASGLAASLTNRSSDFTVGKVTKYGNVFDGLMDILEVYNRVLTSAEITELYNSGNGVACTGRSAAAAPANQNFILFE